MTKLILAVMLMVVTGVATSVAAPADPTASISSQTINDLAATIEEDVNMPCKTEAGCVEEIRVAIKGHITAAAGHSEDKFWALFTEVRKVFYDREQKLDPVINNISTADLVSDKSLDEVLAYQNASLALAALDELFVVHVAQEVLGG